MAHTWQAQAARMDAEFVTATHKTEDAIISGLKPSYIQKKRACVRYAHKCSLNNLIEFK